MATLINILGIVMLWALIIGAVAVIGWLLAQVVVAVRRVTKMDDEVEYLLRQFNHLTDVVIDEEDTRLKGDSALEKRVSQAEQMVREVSLDLNRRITNMMETASKDTSKQIALAIVEKEKQYGPDWKVRLDQEIKHIRHKIENGVDLEVAKAQVMANDAMTKATTLSGRVSELESSSRLYSGSVVNLSGHIAQLNAWRKGLDDELKDTRDILEGLRTILEQWVGEEGGDDGTRAD